MANEKEVIVEPKEYNCLCASCNDSWTSSGKPSKCPNCGSKEISYSEA
jgi:Zn finger protein HypA/HybF involved in hydrogenase expression